MAPIQTSITKGRTAGDAFGPLAKRILGALEDFGNDVKDTGEKVVNGGKDAVNAGKDAADVSCRGRA
jgi:hypothetical protein